MHKMVWESIGFPDKYDSMVTMRISHIIIVFVITLVVFLGNCGMVLASSMDQIGKSNLDPSSPVYFLKTIRESLETKFAGMGKARWLKELEFSTRRIREVNALITKEQDLIAPTLEKYKSNLSSIPQKDLGDPAIVSRIKDSLTLQLNDLLAVYGQVANSTARMAIRAAINAIVLRVDIPQASKLPACSFLKSEASSSALNQTEKAVYSERAKNCFGL